MNFMGEKKETDFVRQGTGKEGSGDGRDAIHGEKDVCQWKP
jgi:hypothetical protein